MVLPPPPHTARIVPGFAIAAVSFSAAESESPHQIRAATGVAPKGILMI
jgi:hypothetical protein